MPLLVSFRELVDSVKWPQGEPPSWLDTALQVAFATSLIANEGRRARVSIAVGPPDSFGSDAFRFATPEPFAVEAVRELFPALDQSSCLAATAVDNGELFLLGIIPQDSVSQMDETGCVVITIAAPGCVSLSVGWHEAHYQRGDVVPGVNPVDARRFALQDTANLIEWSLALEFGLETLRPKRNLYPIGHFDIPERLRALDKKLIRKHVRDVALLTAVGAITRAIHVFREAAHGAAVLILPKDSVRRVRRHIGKARWLGDSDPKSSAMYCTAATSAISSLKKSTIEKKGWLFAEAVQSGTALSRYSALWNVELRRSAALCGTDGALILNHGYAPIAFGATLNFRSHGELDGYPSERGHRHRAIADAVGATPGAVGIVISEDGGGIVLRRDGSRLGRLVIPS